jgi:surfeit locus 1 family protein
VNGARLKVFVALAVIGAAVCIRLGFWQVRRLEERRARNAMVEARLQAAPVDIRELPRDTAVSRYRRVRVSGVPDYEHELTYAGRTRRGSPGVYILTPIRVPESDTAILVNRGWVYAPDAATVDLAKWHDRDSVFVGYAEQLASSGGTTYTGKPRVIARLSHEVASKALPYPVAPTYVVALAGADSTTAADRIARLPIPPLDEGSHFSYAIQWFGFAAVALIGAGIVIKQARSSASTADDDPTVSRDVANESR